MPRPTRPRETPADPDRTLHCPHFGTCGGCSLLDQPIRWQLHHKVEACERLLAPFLHGQRIACDTPEAPPRHFRTRLLYPVRRDRDGLPIVGIYEFHSHHLVRIDECRTQDAWLTAFGREIERVLREMRLEPYVPGKRRGQVKAIWARLAAGSGEVLAGIVTRPGTFPAGPTFAASVMGAAQRLPRGRRPRQLVGVVHSISERDDEFLLGDRHLPLKGRDHVVDRRDGLSLRVSAGSFYQIHAGAPSLLYAPAIAMCGDVRGRTVVDGYGGVGAFGLRLAKLGAGRVTIVEDNAAAVRDAKHNVQANALANVDVLAAPFGTARVPAAADVMLVDPPRSGLGTAGVERVLTARPQRLVYVACAADALAHDLGPLTAHGYRVTAARLCDLFPHTEHVELVVRLDRSPDGRP